MLTKLKYFCAVVKRKNFTEAAFDCDISQSAISQQIRSLEDMIGVKLINRNYKGEGTEYLTPAGEYFYLKSLHLLEEFERITNRARKIQNEKETNFSIGVLHGFDSEVFQRAYARFNEIFPELRCSVLYGSHTELAEMIRNDLIDININDLRRVMPLDYHHVLLTKVPVSIVISREDPLSEREAVSFEDLQSRPCILIAREKWKESEISFMQTYFSYQGDFLFCENIEAAALEVAKGNGYLMWHSKGGLSVFDLEQTVFVPLLVGDQQLTFTNYAFWKVRKNEEYQYEQVFADLLQEEIEAIRQAADTML